MNLHKSLALYSSLIFILIASSCKKLPETDFTYSPTENPEAGLEIKFENITENGDSYSWTFGDGGFSSEENPTYIFDAAGSYDINLTATNDDGEQSKIKTLNITEPTNLVFFILDSTGANLLIGAEVLLYDNESDWNNLEEPIQVAVTDAEGKVVFRNMDPIVYYIWALKEEAEGGWISFGYTSPIAQNETSLFNVPCFWVADEAKSTRSRPGEPLQLIKRVH